MAERTEDGRHIVVDGWRGLMDLTREVTAELVAAGEVEVTQKGEVVELSEALGPIRIRRTDR